MPSRALLRCSRSPGMWFQWGLLAGGRLMGGEVLSCGTRELRHSWRKAPINRTPGRLEEWATWHSSNQKFLIVKKMSLNAFVHENSQKLAFLFISSAFTHHATSWENVPSQNQKHPPRKSPQRVPEFLRFQEPEDYQQCERVTRHLISVTPISDQWHRWGVKTISTSQINPEELHTLAWGRSSKYKPIHSMQWLQWE